MRGRALGVDFGTKRVGIAVSDALGIAASAVLVIEETDPGVAAKRVAAIAKEKDAKVLVVGMPVNMDGSEHASWPRVREFAEKCARFSGLPVEYVDERLTTVSAQRKLHDGGIRGPAGRAVIDQAAAVELLQDWLDRRRR